MTPARDNILLIVVNLDVWHTQDAFIDVPVEDFGWMPGEQYQVHDLLSDNRYLWTGRRNFIRLDPHTSPAHIFRIRRKMGSESNVDYFM
jgi:starch synthase (maltosyl-transferring)